MAARIQLQWKEMRRNGEIFELHLIEATETRTGWSFRDWTTRKIERFSDKSAPLMLEIATVGKAEALSGSLYSGGEYFLKRAGTWQEPELWFGPRRPDMEIDLSVLSSVRYLGWRRHEEPGDREDTCFGHIGELEEFACAPI